MLNIIISFAVSLVLAGNVTLASETPDGSTGTHFVVATTNQALKSLKSAEYAGADVSELVTRFNAAIDLQRQAESGTYSSCVSYDECIIDANKMMLSIVEDATYLSTEATAKKEQANVMTFTVYVPLGSFAASLLIVVAYRAWQNRRIKRYQGMDVHQRRSSSH